LPPQGAAAPEAPASGFAPAPGAAREEAGAEAQTRKATQDQTRALARPLTAGAAGKALPATAALVLRLEPRDPAQIAARVEAAFQAAGAEILTHPDPDHPLLAARVPASALGRLLQRLRALGDLDLPQPLPEGTAGEVAVSVAW
jgi:hypothetical protein